MHKTQMGMMQTLTNLQLLNNDEENKSDKTVADFDQDPIKLSLKTFCLKMKLVTIF